MENKTSRPLGLCKGWPSLLNRGENNWDQGKRIQDFNSWPLTTGWCWTLFKYRFDCIRRLFSLESYINYSINPSTPKISSRSFPALLSNPDNSDFHYSNLFHFPWKFELSGVDCKLIMGESMQDWLHDTGGCNCSIKVMKNLIDNCYQYNTFCNCCFSSVCMRLCHLQMMIQACLHFLSHTFQR